MGHFRILYYSIAIVVGSGVLAVSITRFSRSHARSLWAFVLVYSLSLVHLATVLLANYAMTNLAPAFNLQEVWALARLVNRMRYIALLIFVHIVVPTRFSRMLTIATSSIVVAGTIVVPILVPGQYPIYLLAGTLVYVVGYTATAYLSGSTRGLGEGRRVRALAVFGTFAVPCIAMDTLATVRILPPATGLFVVDVVPPAVVAFGLVYLLVPGNDRPKRPEALHRRWIDHGLSGREIEVADLMLVGYSNRQIASRLFISVSTVKKHVNHIFTKLKMGSRWELIRYLPVDMPDDGQPRS